MQTEERLHHILCTVGLLRSRISIIIQGINDLRRPYETKGQPPPEILGPLMVKAQNHSVALLKSTEILVTARENIKRSRPGQEVFDTYLEDWALSQVRLKIKPLLPFLDEVSSITIDGMEFDPRIRRDGNILIRRVFEQQIN